MHVIRAEQEAERRRVLAPMGRPPGKEEASAPGDDVSWEPMDTAAMDDDLPDGLTGS